MIEDVKCPDCGGPMVSRRSQHGVFWGCKSYPRCTGTRDADGNSRRERDADRAADAARRPSRWDP